MEVGQRAPDAALVNVDRKAVKLSELRGKPAVLVFFPGAFTGACTKEMRAFGVQDQNWAGGLMPGVAMRSVFVLDRDGVVRYKWVAPTQPTEPDYAAVEAAVKALD